MTRLFLFIQSDQTWEWPLWFAQKSLLVHFRLFPTCNLSTFICSCCCCRCLQHKAALIGSKKRYWNKYLNASKSVQHLKKKKEGTISLYWLNPDGVVPRLSTRGCSPSTDGSCSALWKHQSLIEMLWFSLLSLKKRGFNIKESKIHITSPLQLFDWLNYDTV